MRRARWPAVVGTLLAAALLANASHHDDATNVVPCGSLDDVNAVIAESGPQPLRGLSRTASRARRRLANDVHEPQWREDEAAGMGRHAAMGGHSLSEVGSQWEMLTPPSDLERTAAASLLPEGASVMGASIDSARADGLAPAAADAAAANATAAGAEEEEQELKPVTAIPLHPGSRCETPYSSDVRLHVIITLKDRTGYHDLRYLGALGLTNADIFAYLRNDPGDGLASHIELPCGMRWHERLLLPNLGEEGATFLTHVASVYDDMPDAVIALHGGQLSTWHAHCSVAIRRMRAFYRGLGTGPEATPTMRRFASDVVTLNTLNHKGGLWIANDCCGPMMSKYHVHTDYPECPWERVGTSPIDFEGVHTQALCQLRDRTPDTNWTLLSTDIPEFFLKPRQILAKYEDDPTQAVPITHVRGAGVPGPPRIDRTMSLVGGDAALLGPRAAGGDPVDGDRESAAADDAAPLSNTTGRRVDAVDAVDAAAAVADAASEATPEAAAAAPPPRREKVGVTEDESLEATQAEVENQAEAQVELRAGGRIIAGERASSKDDAGLAGGSRAPSSRKLAAWWSWGGGRSPAAEPLVNFRDVVFPDHRQRDLISKKGGGAFANHKVYGLERFWFWALKQHGLYYGYMRKAKEGESAARWCCMQVAAPRHVLKTAPKEWWQDVAFLVTNLGWKPQPEWPVSFGFLIEWRMWPSLNKRYLTKDGFGVYLDVERELGEDPTLAQCEAELGEPV